VFNYGNIELLPSRLHSKSGLRETGKVKSNSQTNRTNYNKKHNFEVTGVSKGTKLIKNTPGNSPSRFSPEIDKTETKNQS